MTETATLSLWWCNLFVLFIHSDICVESVGHRFVEDRLLLRFIFWCFELKQNSVSIVSIGEAASRVQFWLLWWHLLMVTLRMADKFNIYQSLGAPQLRQKYNRTWTQSSTSTNANTLSSSLRDMLQCNVALVLWISSIMWLQGFRWIPCVWACHLNPKQEWRTSLSKYSAKMTIRYR